MEKRVNALLLSSTNYLEQIKCDIAGGTAPFQCAVPKCKNQFVSLEKHKKSPFKFHNFPKNHILSQRWKAVCNLAPDISTKNLKVCSDHFTLDDYRRNLKEEFLNPLRKRPLKATAVPSVNVYVVDDNELKEYLNCDFHPEDNQEDHTEDDIVLNRSKETEQLVFEVDTLKKEIKSAENKIRLRKKGISKRTETLEEYENTLKKLKTEKEEHTKRTLQTFLSEAQISVLRGKKKKVFWSDDDLAQAFTLRHMGGKDFYLYMKNTLNYPLPSLSCVQAWAGN